VAEAVRQLLVEADVEGLIAAGRYERNGEWSTWRNGYREDTLGTRFGSLQLRIPKLRQSLLTRRRGAAISRRFSRSCPRARSGMNSCRTISL
jgi:transposase-like protein